MFVYKFKFEGEDKTIALKPFDQLPAGILRKNRNNDAEGMWAMLEWALTEKDLETFDLLPANQLEEVLEKWQKDAEVDAPKS